MEDIIRITYSFTTTSISSFNIEIPYSVGLALLPSNLQVLLDTTGGDEEWKACEKNTQLAASELSTVNSSYVRLLTQSGRPVTTDKLSDSPPLRLRRVLGRRT